MKGTASLHYSAPWGALGLAKVLGDRWGRGKSLLVSQQQQIITALETYIIHHKASLSMRSSGPKQPMGQEHYAYRRFIQYQYYSDF